MEYKLSFIVLLFMAVSLQGRQISPRVFFGTKKNDTNNEHFTYLAGLFDRTGPYCSGFVLSRKAILTAAHCIETVQISFGFYIRSSDKFIARINVDHLNQTNFHPEYNPDTKENDFAVITLLWDMDIEPPPKLTTTETNENTTCIVSGFGLEDSGAWEPILPTFKEVEVIACDGQTPGRICAEAQINSSLRAGVLCDGDAGATLVCNNELVGIAVSDNNCGTGGPDVYQSVIGFQAWIEEQVANAGQEGISSTPMSTSTREPGSASTSVLNLFAMIATLSVIFKITLTSISI